MSKRKRPPAVTPLLVLARPQNAPLATEAQRFAQSAVAAYARGDGAEAERLCRMALGIDADNFDALHLLGVLAASAGHVPEALALLTRAVARVPGNPHAQIALGATLSIARRYGEALAHFEQAIVLDPALPLAHYNLATTLSHLDRYAEAVASSDRALALAPDFAPAWYARGHALRNLLQTGPATASFERAIALDPQHASAHWSLAVCRLLVGDFAGGWREYSWRLVVEPEPIGGTYAAPPLWDGSQPLRGKTIVVYAEHGLGDTLQYVRYVSALVALGAAVVVVVQRELLALLGTMREPILVLPQGAEAPRADFRCPMMNLPYAFRSDLRTIPAPIPYVHSENSRLASWRARVESKPGARVGIAWSGSDSFANRHRRIALDDLLPICDGRLSWISVQKEVRAADNATLASRPDIRHFGAELADFSDTAALLDLVDLVITVDTSIAHLAGAMGREVWILLPFNPVGWIWMLERADSAWYPTARLFRQSAPGDWRTVIAQVRDALRKRFPQLA